jgi:copper chaperone CopZ
MKQFIALSSLLAFGSLASAQDAPAAEKCPAQKCPSACAIDCCDGTLIKFAVTGLDNDQAAISAEVVLGAQAAIGYCKSCPESGSFTVKYNPDKTKVAEIEKVLIENGLKITGQKASFKIAGLACQSCSNHLTTVLGKTDGVVNVDQICHKSGHAEITFDPKKTDSAKLKAAINTTKYKVVEADKKPATAPAPQS